MALAGSAQPTAATMRRRIAGRWWTDRAAARLGSTIKDGSDTSSAETMCHGTIHDRVMIFGSWHTSFDGASFSLARCSCSSLLVRHPPTPRLPRSTLRRRCRASSSSPTQPPLTEPPETEPPETEPPETEPPVTTTPGRDFPGRDLADQHRHVAGVLRHRQLGGGDRPHRGRVICARSALTELHVLDARLRRHPIDRRGFPT